MNDEERTPLEDKLTKALKNFASIVVSENSLLQQPRDLEASKKGAIVCLTVGIVGIAVLAYLKAVWYSYVALVFLVSTTTILVFFRKQNDKEY